MVVEQKSATRGWLHPRRTRRDLIVATYADRYRQSSYQMRARMIVPIRAPARERVIKSGLTAAYCSVVVRLRVTVRRGYFGTQALRCPYRLDEKHLTSLTAGCAICWVVT